jgi:hypothetical protein
MNFLDVGHDKIACAKTVEAGYMLRSAARQGCAPDGPTTGPPQTPQDATTGILRRLSAFLPRRIAKEALLDSAKKKCLTGVPHHSKLVYVRINDGLLIVPSQFLCGAQWSSPETTYSTYSSQTEEARNVYRNQ